MNPNGQINTAAEAADLFRRIYDGKSLMSDLVLECGPGIVFTPEGLNRLALTVGGLAFDAERRELRRQEPNQACLELLLRLRYLGHYGGKVGTLVREGTPWERTVEVPQYKVQVMDAAAGWGNFTLQWFKAMPAQRVPEMARKLDPEADEARYADGREMDQKTSTDRWRKALWTAREDLGIPVDRAGVTRKWATESRSYLPAKERQLLADGKRVPPHSHRHVSYVYGYAMEGGLVFEAEAGTWRVCT